MRKKVKLRDIVLILLILSLTVYLITDIQKLFQTVELERIDYDSAIKYIEKSKVYEIKIYESTAEICLNNTYVYKKYIVDIPDQEEFLEIVQKQIESGDKIRLRQGDNLERDIEVFSISCVVILSIISIFFVILNMIKREDEFQ